MWVAKLEWPGGLMPSFSEEHQVLNQSSWCLTHYLHYYGWKDNGISWFSVLGLRSVVECRGSAWLYFHESFCHYNFFNFIFFPASGQCWWSMDFDGKIFFLPAWCRRDVDGVGSLTKNFFKFFSARGRCDVNGVEILTKKYLFIFSAWGWRDVVGTLTKPIFLFFLCPKSTWRRRCRDFDKKYFCNFYFRPRSMWRWQYSDFDKKMFYNIFSARRRRCRDGKKRKL